MIAFIEENELDKIFQEILRASGNIKENKKLKSLLEYFKKNLLHN